MDSSSLAAEYFERLRRFDRHGASALVGAYIERTGSVEQAFDDILRPALVHAGSEWEADRISVAHEHYITEITRSLIEAYALDRQVVRGGGPAVKVVAGCAPSERHALGLMMISQILRSEGLDVYALGEGAPAASIRDLILEVGAEVLCVSIAMAEHLGEGAELIRVCRAARPGLKVIVGGWSIREDPARAAEIGADAHAVDLAGTRELARRLRDGSGESAGARGKAK